jgi:hypothetical protein
VATEREERLMRNEALFRTANERAAAWEERHEEPNEVELYHCECADLECREKVPLTVGDYERVRADSTQFFVLPGHELPDVETVIETHAEWAVIRKDPEVQGIAEATDDRSPTEG